MLHIGDRAAFRTGGALVVGNITGRTDGPAPAYDLIGDRGELVIGAAAADVTAAPAYEPRIGDLVAAPGRLLGRVEALDSPARRDRRAYIRTPRRGVRPVAVSALRPAAQIGAFPA